MHDLLDRPSSTRSSHPLGCLVAGLLLFPGYGCVQGEGVLGEYTETDTGSGTDTDSDGVPEPGCEEECDPDFAVAVVSAANFMLEPVHVPGDATCEGPRCPAAVVLPVVGGMPVEACAGSQAALASPVGPEEHCRFAAASLTGASLAVAFTTPVERSSFEQTRPRPEDPTQQEPYLWHPDVVELQGPGTALRGDYRHAARPGQPDRLAAVVNETCAARLTALGIPWVPTQLESLCAATWDDGGVLRPLRQDPAMGLTPYAGELSTRTGWQCQTPDAGPDTCCSPCDLALGPKVARYGVDATGNRRNANAGTALSCDPAGDALVECRALVLDVEREPEGSYTYAWDGAPQAWPLPLYDKLRETHPDDRPAGLEAPGAACINGSDCDAGQDCIGIDAAGRACRTGEDCVARTCRSEWFGACQVTSAGAASCVDRRFNATGAGACLVATADFGGGGAGDRLVQCDANADGLLLASECCDPALGGGAGCDPFYQPALAVVERYDRDPTGFSEGLCACAEDQPATCAEVMDAWCEAPWGAASDPGPASAPGSFAVPAVTRLGGVRWDEDLQRMSVRLADIGQVPRASVEACAEARGLIGGRSPADGWMAHTDFVPELHEDHDRALCSGSTYQLVFAESSAVHHVRSAGQGSLDGRAVHVIETAQFRVVPGSLLPAEAETIASCGALALRLSNRHDPSESNVRKLELHQGSPDGPLVAGGPGCSPLAGPVEIAAGAIPCLTIDPVNDSVGELRFLVDESIHGPVLQPGTTYFAVLPGLADVAQMSDAESYAAAFHDACGMPLIVGSTPEALALSELAFTVDVACS
jgi:hypothetical protein